MAVKSNVKHLDEVLRCYNKNIKILEQSTALLTAPGEHYGSVMLALDVSVMNEPEKLHLVAKLPPVNEMLRIAFDIQVTFKKEVIAYTEAIPALVQLQKSHGISPENYQDTLFPKCYGARINLNNNNGEIDDDAVILFENLKIQNYITEDRLKGFDLIATKVILKDLAQFHAVPIALKLHNREEFEKKILPALVDNKGLEQLPSEIGKAFHDAIMEGANEVIELEPYLKQIKHLVDEELERPYAVSHPHPNEPWGTMSHADFWVSNTMILKGSNNTTIKNKIVDLQLMRYQSACRDLVFFLLTSVINSVLDENFDYFLKFYHDNFIDVLKSLNIDTKPFSWELFLKELNQIAPTEIYHVLVMLKPICTERGKVKNSLEDFEDSDWSRKDLLGPNHRRKLRDTVLAIVKRGWL